MRIAVLILSILGSIGAGFLGAKWLSDHQKVSAQIRDMAEKMKVSEEEAMKFVALLSDKPEAFAEYKTLVNAAYALCVGAVVGLITGVLIFARKVPGVVGGIILILCAAIPAAIVPKTLVFSGLLIVAGLLAFVVKTPRRLALDVSPAEDLG